jgi:hypothetical protein
LHVETDTCFVKQITHCRAVFSDADCLIHWNRAIVMTHVLVALYEPGTIPRVQVANMPSTIDKPQFRMGITDRFIRDADVTGLPSESQ